MPEQVVYLKTYITAFCQLVAYVCYRVERIWIVLCQIVCSKKFFFFNGRSRLFKYQLGKVIKAVFPNCPIMPCTVNQNIDVRHIMLLKIVVGLLANVQQSIVGAARNPELQYAVGCP